MNFDQLANKMDVLDLSDMKQVTIDFGIALPRLKLVDIYNKSSVNHEPL